MSGRPTSTKSPATNGSRPRDTTSIAHRELLGGDFWRRIEGYADVSEETFLDSKWQSQKSIQRPEQLRSVLGSAASDDFLADVADGLHRAPMSLRVTPYMLSLIDWSDPYDDPIRRQFIPVGSSHLPDHPKLTLDSLGEQADSAAPGLTHRYPDRALFLALDICPVYCRFCTRSYSVGSDTDEVEKVHFRPTLDRWSDAFAYIEATPELEDILVSGGDAYLLRPTQLRQLGERLLGIDHVRRIRIATKGPAVMPMKLLTDDEWVGALEHIVNLGRKLHKEVCLHTHFGHASEMTEISKRALDRMFEMGVIVRNQGVLQRGVNDSIEDQHMLVKRLSYLNVQSYYIYIHDLVSGVEDLRTTLQTGLDLEKQVRGWSAGFNTPTFVCDAPGGGGKRSIHSFEHYDRTSGVSVWTAPSVKHGFFLYFDPIDTLTDEAQERWKDPVEQDLMIDEAVESARANHRDADRASHVPMPGF